MTLSTLIKVSLDAATEKEKVEKTEQLVNEINKSIGVNCSHFDSNQISCNVRDLDEVKNFLLANDIDFNSI